MKYFFLIISFFISLICLSQKKLFHAFPPSGLYRSAECLDEISECYYFLMQDSSFIYIGIESKKINKVGIGKWLWDRFSKSNGDSCFKFIFSDLNRGVLVNTKVTYNSETGNSPDSVYISGRIFSEKGQPISNLLINLNFSNYGCSTNQSGEFSTVKDQNLGISEIEVWGFKPVPVYPVRLKLNANNNIHRFQVSMSHFDSLSVVPVKAGEMTKVNWSKKLPRYPGLGIEFISKDGQYLRDVINEAIIKQPDAANLFKFLIGLMKTK